MQPIIMEALKTPSLASATEKFGPCEFQVSQFVKLQDSTTARLILNDGQYSISGMYRSAESDVSEDTFAAGQILLLSDHTFMTSNGRPYVYFPSYEPKGIAEVPTVEKMSATMYKDIRQSLGLSLDGTVEEDGAGAEAEATPAAAPTAAPAASAAPAAPVAVGTVGDSAPSSRPKGITGIEAVSPFLDTWKIRARCTQKGDVRRYKKNDREGQLFNVTFVDETGEIRATAFGDEVDKFYNVLQDGQLYYITRCKVSPAQKKFNTTNNDFELMMGRDTEIEAAEVDSTVPGVIFKFVSLKELDSRPKDSTVDVLGVMTVVGSVSTFTSKSGQPFDKRAVSIVDQSGTEIEVTLWGQEAQSFAGKQYELLAIKAARLGEFNNQKQLSVQRSSQVVLNPMTQDAIKLRGWYDAHGRTQKFERVAAAENAPKQMQLEFIEQVLKAESGTYHSIRGTVDNVLQKTLYYPSCAQANCLKKVVQTTNSDWRCESCDVEMPEPRYRYILTLSLSDCIQSEGMLVTAFDDIAQELVGVPANEIARLRIEDEQSPEVTAILNKLQGHQYYFRVQAKLESYNNQERMKFRCFSAKPLPWNKVSAGILEELGI